MDRRDEATREMRRLVRDLFGREALGWFDRRSEPWRGIGTGIKLNYGAFFGSAYDRDGLNASKIYYETLPDQIDGLPLELFGIVARAMDLAPGLYPLFTTIACERDRGGQKLTFLHRPPLKLAALQPLLDELGLGHRLPGIMQIVGLALGGRFELPPNATLVALGNTHEGPEFELMTLLGMIPDVPPNFLDLLTLGMSERPRELSALISWLRAFTPEDDEWPGRFSILSVRTTPVSPPRVAIYLRPAEFEIRAPALEPHENGAAEMVDAS
jgi:hypothetical protein